MPHHVGCRIEETRTKEDTLPEYGAPFSGLANIRKLTNEGLICAVRFMIAGEYEAIQLYVQLAESADNKLAIVCTNDSFHCSCGRIS